MQCKPNNPPEETNRSHCSFCGKTSSPSRRMIAGLPISGRFETFDLFICEDCVDICVRVLVEEGRNRWIVVEPERKEEKPHKD
ncbi:MAG: hypothetical protein LBB83_05690 [Treponema sp.]|jgi:hypothetical protein|nr:hypothetical protein [Treponema sp.]